MPCSFLIGGKGLRQRQLVFTWEMRYCVFWKRREVREKPWSLFVFGIPARKGAERMETQRFGEGLQKALSQEIWEEEKREQLRAMGYRGTWMDLLFQAQVERAAKGDATAFRLLRDAMAEAAEEEEKVRSLTQEDLKRLRDEELRAMLGRCREGEE